MRQKGIISLRFVRPISSRTFFIGAAFEREAGLVARMVVARCTAEAEHRIFLDRLVGAAADQVGVFVGLEVAQPHDHILGIERGGDHGDALGELVDEELRLVVVAGGQTCRCSL